jgi:hypothetical protein
MKETRGSSKQRRIPLNSATRAARGSGVWRGPGVTASRGEYLLPCYKGCQGFRCMKGTRGDSQQREIPFTLLQGLPRFQVYDGDQGYQPAEENTFYPATRAARGSGV